jgi:hypothetical protein
MTPENQQKTQKSGDSADSVGVCKARRNRSENRPMFKIGRIPPSLEGFFKPLADFFLYNHYTFFRDLVVMMAYAWGPRTVANLHRHLDPRGRSWRTRYNNFLNLDRWDAPAALRAKAMELLAKVLAQAPRRTTIYMVIDDSKKSKRGKKMEAVGFLHDSTTGRTIKGHNFIQANLEVNGVTIPWGVHLYAKKEDCPKLGLRFRKLTELAADLISSFTPPEGYKVRVAFDIFYLCPQVIKPCRRKGFFVVSALKRNRNLFLGGRKLKAGNYGKNCFRRRLLRHLTVDGAGGPAHYTFVDAGHLAVGDLGQMRVIFSRKNKDPKILGIVTDDPDLTPEELIRAYGVRWRIEVFFKDCKQHLGLGQYQNAAYAAAVIHLHLVCFARALLTHLSLRRKGEKGKKRKSAARLSVGQLQNELRRILWRDLSAHLAKCHTGDQVIAELDRLLMCKKIPA